MVFTSSGEVLGEVGINCGIFLVDFLSPLLFLLTMTLPTMLLKREKIGYGFEKQQSWVNHLMLMEVLS